MASPLKQIVLTYHLNRDFGSNDGSDDGKFEVSEEQVIHVEPLESGEMCAVTMLKSGSDFHIDIKTKYPQDYYKVSSADLIKAAIGASYDYDLNVTIAKESIIQTKTHAILSISDTDTIVSGCRIDLTFNPPMLKFGLDARDNFVINNKADPDRICRIGVV